MKRTSRRVVVVAVLAASAAQANPIVSAEVDVDPRVTAVPARADLAQHGAPIACNAAGCLAVWGESGGPSTPGVAIRATRFSPAGAVLGSSVLLAASSDGNLFSPTVATDGSGFLVAWTHTTNVVATRVSATGAVLDPAGVVVGSADVRVEDPAVAWNGHDYLVVWSARTAAVPASAIRGARVSAAGVVRDPVPLVLGGTASPRQQYPLVAAAGDRFVVAWDDARAAGGDVYVARVGADGALLDPGGMHPFATFRGRQLSALASDGARVLLGWLEGTPSYVAALGDDGLAIGAGTRVSEPSRTFSLAFDGSHFLAAWSVDAGLAFTRLTPAGVPLPADLRTAPSGIFDRAALAVGGAGFVGVTSRMQVFRVGADGAAPASFVDFATSANPQTEARISSDGAGFVVTWSDRATATAARIAASGAVLDAPPLSLGAAITPRVAFDGTSWLATWSTGSATAAARIPASGPPVPGTATSTEGFFAPESLGDGRGYLMLAGRTRGLGYQYSGEMRRLAVPSLAAGARTVVTPQTSTQNGVPTVGFDGTNHLVAWHEGGNLPPYCAYVSVLRVTPAGERLDPMPQRLTPCLVGDPLLEPSIAFDGTNYLVAWHAPGAVDVDVFAARVSRAGVVLDAPALVISAAVGDQRNPTALYDGTRFVLAWEDRRAGNLDVYGARVLSSGAVVDPAGFALAASSTDEGGPRLAVRAGGRAMLAYVRRSPTLGVDRVEVRTATFDDAPLDAGVADAGTTDAGMADAGTSDAGTADASIDSSVAVVDGGADVVHVVDVATAPDVAAFVDVASAADVLGPRDAPRVAVDAAAAAPGDAGGCSVAGEPGARRRPARGALALGVLAFAACVRRRRRLATVD